MRDGVFSLVHGRFGILWCIAVLLSATSPAKALLSGQDGADCPPLAWTQGVENLRSDF